MNVISESEVKRIFKIAKFLGVKYDEKKKNILEFGEYLYEKIMEWEDENQMEFSI